MNTETPFDVLCVGLVCVDLVLSVPHHPAPDEKLRAVSRLVTPGGPAAVAAAQIARLGGKVAFAGLIGNETGDPFVPLLRRAFLAEEIEIASLHCVPGHETPLAALLVKPDATRAVVSHRPEPPPSAHITHKVTFPAARVVLTDGHRPEWRDSIVAHARATGSPLVLDAGSWSDAVRALAGEADHIVASEACARAALGGRDPATAADDLPSALGARPEATVVATLGSRGLVWREPNGGGSIDAFHIQAVDTTGAGDAFHGAYALGLARGLPLPTVLRLASAAGALACTRPGAWTAPTNSPEIEALLAIQDRY